MNLQSKIALVAKRAQKQGWRYVKLANSHNRFLAPDGKTVVQCSSTTRDGAWWGKFMHDMKAAGYRDSDTFITATNKPLNKPQETKVESHATTSLGEALREAKPAASPLGLVPTEPVGLVPEGTYIRRFIDSKTSPAP